jgi:hypothetical protein
MKLSATRETKLQTADGRIFIAVPAALRSEYNIRAETRFAAPVAKCDGEWIILLRDRRAVAVISNDGAERAMSRIRSRHADGRYIVVARFESAPTLEAILNLI